MGAMASDTSYTTVALPNRLIDIIDNEWTEDCLSDDGECLLQLSSQNSIKSNTCFEIFHVSMIE